MRADVIRANAMTDDIRAINAEMRRLVDGARHGRLEAGALHDAAVKHGNSILEHAEAMERERDEARSEDSLKAMSLISEATARADAA